MTRRTNSGVSRASDPPATHPTMRVQRPSPRYAERASIGAPRPSASPTNRTTDVENTMFTNPNQAIFGAALSTSQTLIDGGALSMAEVELLLERYQPERFEKAMGRKPRPFDENGQPIDKLGLPEGEVAKTAPVTPAPAEESKAEKSAPESDAVEPKKPTRAERRAAKKAAEANKAAPLE